VLLAAPAWKQNLLTVHVEELESLWLRRLAGWRSPEWTDVALRRLDERILAHADALVLAGDEAMLVLEQALGSEAWTAVLGAAHVLLSREDGEGVRAAHAGFGEARGPALEAWGVALRHAPVEPHRELLQRAARGEDEPHAAAALSALIFHGLDVEPLRLPWLARARDPMIRRQAWEAVAYLGAALLAASSAAGLRSHLAEVFRASLDEPDLAVRAALLEAAVWTRQPWLLTHLRGRAAGDRLGPEDLPELRLLARIGVPEDAPLLRAAADAAALEAESEELLQAADSLGASAPGSCAARIDATLRAGGRLADVERLDRRIP
jgi:hypothetical protein